MADTLKLDFSGIDFSYPTPEDEMQSWYDEPTMLLRWENGILQQMHRRYGVNAHGRRVNCLDEWKAVPTAPATQGE